MILADLRDDHVETLLVRNLEQLLQLQFIVHQLTLGLHDGIFVVGALGRQLGEVGLRHLAHSQHFLATLLVLLARLQHLLVHLHVLVEIEDLRVDLCDSLLDGVGRLLSLELSRLLREPVKFYGVEFFVPIPHGPLSAQRVGTVIRGLVHLRVHRSIRYIRHTRILPGLIAYALVRRGAQRRQQRRLGALQVLSGTLLRQLLLLECDIVLHRVVDTLLKGPTFLCRHRRHRQQHPTY